MRKGFYTRQGTIVDFHSYRVPYFQFPANLYSSGSCGSNALEIITGIDSNFFLKKNKKRETTTDKFMVKALKACKIEVVEITQCRLTQDGFESHIKSDHLLLMSQLMGKNEASWVVFHDGELMHNTVKIPINPLEFINRPILTCYMLLHPKWKVSPIFQHKYAIKPFRKEISSCR